MIYLDYAANTPIEKEVLDTYYQATMKYFANPNASHTLGLPDHHSVVAPHGGYWQQKMKMMVLGSTVASHDVTQQYSGSFWLSCGVSVDVCVYLD